MIRPRLQALPRAAAAALLVAGCGGDGGTPPPAPVDWDAIDPIVYSEHVQPVLSANCTTSLCHNASDAAAGLALESYAQLAAGSRFGTMVVPFEPDRSHLWLHMTGAIHPRMPLGRDPLDEALLRFFRRWIEQGARGPDGTVLYSDVVRKAFVACQGENAVAVVDLETGLLARLLPVEAPHSVLVDAATRRLYVSRFETASDNVLVLDADTYDVIDAGRAGTFPALMAITPDGSQLWVTNFDALGAAGDHAVRVMDPATLAPIASFTPPDSWQPHGLAITADGSTVFVTNILTDNLTVFGTDPAPGVIEFGIPLPGGGRVAHEPQQCVLSADESRLFVGALGTDRVFVMDTATYAFTAEVEVGDGPWHLALSPDGTELWVANWLGNSVSVVDVTSPDAPVEVAELSPPHPADADLFPLARPIGIAFSPDGTQVWVTCANDDDQPSGHHPPPDGEKNPGNVVVFERTTRTIVAVAEVPNFARFVSFLP